MCPTLPAVWSRTGCPCWKRAVSLPFLSVELYQSVSSSQLPVLLQCLLPPHVKSSECSTSSTQTYLHEAQVNKLILDPHHKSCGPLHFVCACVCAKIVHASEKLAKIVALHWYGPIIIESRLLKMIIPRKRCQKGHLDWFSLSTCPVFKSLCM